jgi:uncharacterized repeat protein (TIGR03943 family)
VAAVTREVQSVLLFIIGAAVLRISVDGTYVRYVKNWLQLPLMASGVVLVILGLVAAWQDGLLRRLPTESARDHSEVEAGELAHPTTRHDLRRGERHDNGHQHGGPRVAWLLLLPVLAIFLIAPPALGSYAAARDSGAVAKPADTSAFPALPDSKDPVPLALDDFAVRATWDEGRSLRGRTVRLSGFVTPRDTGGWYLTRMALACCAADARAVKVHVREAPDLAPDTWVEVVGRWAPSDGDVSSVDAIPVVTAEEVQQIEEPTNPYEI